MGMIMMEKVKTSFLFSKYKDFNGWSLYRMLDLAAEFHFICRFAIPQIQYIKNKLCRIINAGTDM